MFIKVENLTKVFKVPVRTSGLKATLKQLFKRTYKVVKAVDNLSFTIKKGEFVGYLGPNGAGKSTTIKMLTGILVPDSGVLSVDNIIPHKSRIKYSSKIGVVFGQKSQLWWDLPLIESFELLKVIYKIPKDLYEKHYDWLINGLNIEEFINRPVRLLSLGQRMRAELVASLLHMPEILFLDEPTIGLDATSKQLVRKFLLILNKEYGTTIILTTHDMDDIEALCSRVMVIDNGNLAFDGSISALRSRVHNKKRVTVEYLGLWDKETLPEIEILEVKSNKLLFEFDPVLISPTLVVKWLAEKIEIKDLVIENPPIEEIISRLYGQLS